MKTFNLNALVTVSINTTVEANSLEEAIEIAENRAVEYANRTLNQERQVWVNSVLDGEPFDITES